jgi:hypothetical protein
MIEFQIITITIWISFFIMAFIYGSFALSERFLHYRKVENLKRFYVILKSILIFASILLIAYTIYFIYYDIWVFPTIYDGKGSGSDIMEIFDCRQWFGCGIYRVILRYFEKMFSSIMLLPLLFTKYPFQVLDVFLVATWATVYFYKNHRNDE